MPTINLTDPHWRPQNYQQQLAQALMQPQGQPANPYLTQQSPGMGLMQFAQPLAQYGRQKRADMEQTMNSLADY